MFKEATGLGRDHSPDMGSDHVAFPRPVPSAGEAERDSAGLLPGCRSGHHVSSTLQKEKSVAEPKGVSSAGVATG